MTEISDKAIVSMVPSPVFNLNSRPNIRHFKFNVGESLFPAAFQKNGQVHKGYSVLQALFPSSV
jgi:hypothetical protein